jgi:hypothetical protein
MSDFDLDDLRAELDEFAQRKTKGGRSAREERIIAGFEEIQNFTDQNGRAPLSGEDRDIFERLYAARLDRLRTLEDCRALLASFDRHNLLDVDSIDTLPANLMNEDDLLAELDGVEGSSTITELRHVRATADKRAATEIANRIACKDFEQFRSLFETVRAEIASGARETRRFQTMAEIKKDEFFIVGGQITYVAEMGEEFVTEYGRRDCRLRVIYDNGTESDVLLRSLQRALHRDEAGRYITDPSLGPLFSGIAAEDDMASGTIYVLRSKSDHPLVAANREVLHKIGVTGGDVTRRIANAELDPTFLMAGVEIVASYKLFNINRKKLENIIHKVFDPARMDIEIKDRFGNPVVPREWFLAPIFVINEAVERIKDGTIIQYVYEPRTARLVREIVVSGESGN